MPPASRKAGAVKGAASVSAPAAQPAPGAKPASTFPQDSIEKHRAGPADRNNGIAVSAQSHGGPTPAYIEAVFSQDGLLKDIASYLAPNMIMALTQLRGIDRGVKETVDNIFSSLEELAFDDIDIASPFGDGSPSSERDKLSQEARAFELNGKVSEKMVHFLLDGPKPRINPARIRVLELEGWMSPRALDSLLPRFNKLRALFFEPGPILYPPQQLAALLLRCAGSLTTLSLCYSWSHWARENREDGGGEGSSGSRPLVRPSSTAGSSSGKEGRHLMSLDALATTLSEIENGEQPTSGGDAAAAADAGAGTSSGEAAPVEAAAVGGDGAPAPAPAAPASGKMGGMARRQMRAAKQAAAAAAAAAGSASGDGSGAGSEVGGGIGVPYRAKSIFQETPGERFARLEATRRAVSESAAAHGELASAIRCCNALRVLELTLPMPWPDAVPLADTLPPDAPLRVLELFLRRANLAPEVTALVHKYGRGLRELAVTCQIPNEGQVSCYELGAALVTARRLRCLRLSGFALDMTTVLPHLPHLEELVGTSDGTQGCELALFACPKLTKAHLLERRLCEPDPLGAHIMACAQEAIEGATAAAEAEAERAARVAATPDPSTPVALDLTPRTPRPQTPGATAVPPGSPPRGSAAASASVTSAAGIDAGPAPSTPVARPAEPEASLSSSGPAPLRLPLCGELTELTLVFQQTHAAWEARRDAGLGPAARRAAAEAARRAAQQVPGNTSRGSLRRAFLAALPHCTALQHLDLRRGSEHGPLLAALGASPAAQSLESLTLQHIGDLRHEDVATLLASCPGVTEVYILYCDMGPRGQGALLSALHGMLQKKAKLASWAPGAAAKSGPAHGIRVSFGNASSQLEPELLRAWGEREEGRRNGTLRLPAPPAPGYPVDSLAILQPPTER